jgi:hypothetical protein
VSSGFTFRHQYGGPQALEAWLAAPHGGPAVWPAFPCEDSGEEDGAQSRSHPADGLEGSLGGTRVGV